MAAHGGTAICSNPTESKVYLAEPLPLDAHAGEGPAGPEIPAATVMVVVSRT